MIRSTQLARVLFDSWNAGQMVGTRGCASLNDRALLFRAGRVSVDLILQRQEMADTLVCGQILDELEGLPVTNAQVRLGDAGPPSMTDELGQFAVACHADERPDMLTIKIAGARINCPIPSES